MSNSSTLLHSINTSLVKSLIAEQLPQWAELPIREVMSGGHDNRTFHLGDKMLVRLPSAEGYAAQVEKEQTWLPRLAKQLTIKIPNPIALGVPSKRYPWHWSVYEWIDGKSANQVSLSPTELEELAVQLAMFLNELHQVDTFDAPLAGPHNYYRGAHPSVYDREARDAFTQLQGHIDAKHALALWEQALQSTWTKEPVWVHGDFASGNMLIRDEQLVAIIDFGCMGIGDPACDLVIAWTYLDAHGRNIFRKNLQLDKQVWHRARAWALWKVCITLAAMTDKQSADALKQQCIIDTVISEHLAI